MTLTTHIKKESIRLILSAAAVIYSPFLYGQNQNSVQGELLAKIHHNNQMEIQMGDLAALQSGDRKVRSYGERLVKDHKMADQMILSFAKEHDIPLNIPVSKSEAEKSSDREHHRVTEKLRNTSGLEFDRLFLSTMEKGHTETIAMLNTAMSNLQPSAARDLVGKLIPILKQHQELANHLDQRNKTKG